MWSLLEKIEKNIIEQKVNAAVSKMFFFLSILEKVKPDVSLIVRLIIILSFLKLKLKFLNLEEKL